MSKKIPIVSLRLVREASLPYELENKIKSPKNAYEMFKHLMEEYDRELFCVLAVDNKHQPCYVEIVSKGTVNATLVTPREVFKSALLSNASKIFVAHNHPSGCCSFSASDVNVTKQLIDAGNVLGIPVLDHILVGDYTYTSMREENLCEFFENDQVLFKDLAEDYELEM